MTRRFVFLVTLSLVAMLAAIPAAQSTAAKALLQEGIALLAQHQPQAAIDVLNRAIVLDARFAEAYQRRAAAERELRDYASAMSDLAWAIELRPGFWELFYDRARIREELQDDRAAAADYEEAIAKNPRSVASYNGRARAKWRLNDFAGAAADFSQALVLDPKDAEARAGRTDTMDRKTAPAATTALPVEKPAARLIAKPVEQPIEKPASATVAPRSGPVAAPRPPSPPPPPIPARTEVPSIAFKASDPCAVENKISNGTPWQTPSSAAASSASSIIDGVTLPAPLKFAGLLREQYAGAVSAAQEGMRLVYGQMSDDETQKFEAIWAPLFDFPSRDIVDYLNKLNPLLLQFLAGREAMMRAAAAYEGAVLDGSLAVADDERAGWMDAMAAADQAAETLRSLEAGMSEIARRVEALGNPPSPVDAKCGARKRHQQGLDAIELPVADAMAGLFSGSISVQEAQPEVSFNSYAAIEAEAGLAGGSINRILSDLESAPTPFFALLRVPARAASADFLTLQRQASEWDLFVGYYGWGLNFNVRDATVSFDVVKVDGDTLTFTWGGPESGSTASTAGRKRVVVLRRGAQHAAFSDAWSTAFGQLNSAVAAIRSAVEKERANRVMSDSSRFYALTEMASGLNAQFQRYTGEAQAFATAAERYLSSPSAAARSWNRLSDFSAVFDAAKPAATSAAPQRSAPDPVKAPTAPKRTPEADRTEDIALHQTNLVFLDRTLQSERADLAKETTADRRQVLALRVIQIQSDISAEQDLIASYQTGQIVHTRSAFDEFAQQKFVASVQEEAVRADATRRIANGIERQIALLPEDQRDAMRENARRILDAKTIGSGDVEKARRLAGAINEQLQGYWQGQSAKEEEKAIAAQEHEFYAQTAGMALGAAFVGLGSAALAETFGETAAMTIWGPHLIGGVYGGVTGLVSGGPVEGLKQTVAWSSNVGYMATQFVEGYHGMGENPNADTSEKLWEGAKQMGVAFITGKAFEFGTSLVNHGALAVFGKDSRLFKPVISGTPTIRQQFDAARTTQQFDDAKSLITMYQEKELQLAKLRTSTPQGAPELQTLQGELQKLAASINSSYHSKWLMKYQALPLVRTKFNSRVEQSYQDMMPEMTQILKSQHYEMQGIEFQPVRNASSAGSSSMDLDLALKETPGMVILKNGKPVPLHEFMADAQKALNRAYHTTTGFSAERSDLLLTTSLHPEAFTDRRLLDKNVDFESIHPEDIANIGSVLQVKTAKIEGDAVLSSISKAQASCRESAKEIENMLLPNLRQRLQKAPAGSADAVKLKTSLDHWESVQKTFKQIGTQETDPYAILRLERELRQETGGLGINETIGELSRKFEKLGTALPIR